MAAGDVPWCAAPPRSLACLRNSPQLIHGRNKKQECTVDGNATDSLLIKMCGDKVDLTQKRRCDGGIEEASPSKTHGPTQTDKLDDTTPEASSNRTSAMSTRNCIRENGTWECSTSQHDILDFSARLFALDSRARLVVLALEVGGRWSQEARRLVQLLAQARVRSESPLMRRRMEQAWRLRWYGILSCAAARAFGASLLELRGGHGADGSVPPSHEVERDQHHAGLCG